MNVLTRRRKPSERYETSGSLKDKSIILMPTEKLLGRC
ncbi:hypothetical protein Desor_2236 [Desulfosporosinus orientis DSM 765]|uniref:Uncharacterized protein n=1 Tax=Desulfosporosinus orientis (strain ATCC 19365 / DSM 765 / NCIMB 8382 / VKM B-1628 / Singapore I) TaxID=768706 RepID=G7WB57_DESOD|nr:hypothetical protein Desor_2236 [Desulfosporosinus orientis DSM 765]